VRLAAKLTGWRIDIKSASEFESEKILTAPEPAPEAEEAKTAAAQPAESIGEVATMATEETPEVVSAAVGAAEQSEAVSIEILIPAEMSTSNATSKIRFAEDILASRDGKSRKKDASKKDKDKDAGIKAKKSKVKKKATYYEDEEFES